VGGRVRLAHRRGAARAPRRADRERARRRRVRCALRAVIGAAAALVGRAAIFSALAAVSVVLMAITLRLETAPVEHPSLAAVGRALRDRRFLAGLGLMVLASLLFGILGVLCPLRLSAAGWGAAAIGGIWLTGAGSKR